MCPPPCSLHPALHPAAAQKSAALPPLPLEQLAALQHMQALTGAAPEPAPATTVAFGGWRGAGAGAGFGAGFGAPASASPFQPNLSAGQLPVISEVRISGGRRSLDKRRSGKGGQSVMLAPVAERPEREAGEVPSDGEDGAGDADDDAVSETSLVDELAEQAKAEAQEHGRMASGGGGPRALQLGSRLHAHVWVRRHSPRFAGTPAWLRAACCACVLCALCRGAASLKRPT